MFYWIIPYPPPVLDWLLKIAHIHMEICFKGPTWTAQMLVDVGFIHAQSHSFRLVQFYISIRTLEITHHRNLFCVNNRDILVSFPETVINIILCEMSVKKYGSWLLTCPSLFISCIFLLNFWCLLQLLFIPANLLPLWAPAAHSIIMRKHLWVLLHIC